MTLVFIIFPLKKENRCAKKTKSVNKLLGANSLSIGFKFLILFIENHINLFRWNFNKNPLRIVINTSQQRRLKRLHSKIVHLTKWHQILRHPFNKRGAHHSTRTVWHNSRFIVITQQPMHQQWRTTLLTIFQIIYRTHSVLTSQLLFPILYSTVLFWTQYCTHDNGLAVWNIYRVLIKLFFNICRTLPSDHYPKLHLFIYQKKIRY